MRTNKILIGVGIALLIYLGFSTCETGLFSVEGNGELVKKTFDVSEFHAIKAGGVFQIEYEQSNTQMLTIETDENILPLIEARVEDGELVLNCTNILCEPTKIIVIVKCPNLDEIDLSGASDFTTIGKFITDYLKVELSGASKAEIDVEAKKIELDFSGASKSSMSGLCDQLFIECSGASSVKCKELHSTHVFVDCSGASDVVFSAITTIKVRASGASNVKYYSETTNLDVKISGAAKLARIK